MKVFIKNKLISIEGSSEVLNEQQEVIYKIEGKLISPTKKKRMYDKDGNLLYTIRNKWFTFFKHKTFVIDANKTRVATIVKNKWSFNHKYKIVDCLDEMEINGKFFSRTSTILKNGQEVATITREALALTDCFVLEANEEDIEFLTALVIAFDNIVDNRQGEDR